MPQIVVVVLTDATQIEPLLAGWVAALVAGSAHAHGDVTPQAVDTKELPQLGDNWRGENPYRKNAAATKIGASAYNQNCARCHGLEAVSGGIAPDLRRGVAVDDHQVDQAVEIEIGERGAA